MTATTDTRPASPLRAALAALTSLCTYHDIAVAPQTRVETAQRKLDAARQLQVATMLSDDQAVKEKADRALETAQAERDACFHRIYFRGLDTNEFDALVALHPPTAEEAKDGASWHSDTFIPGLLAECAGAMVDGQWVSGGLTAEEWADEIAQPGKWPAAERRALVSMVIAAQRQTMADAIPKG